MLATQNPIEYEGTFPLPEAQLDRFMLRISLGYPSLRARTVFFVVGCQKSGTTWVYQCLRDHPEIALPLTRREWRQAVRWAKDSGLTNLDL